MRVWRWQRWLLTAAVAATVAVVIGVPTGIIRTSIYTRMTPVLWWNYPIWAVSSLATGLIVATYLWPVADMSKGGTGRVTFGGLLSAFAVGCPICNKLVVAVLGVSGALNIWAPIQPFLGLASVAILIVALLVRLRGERRCALRLPRFPAGS